MKSILYTLLLLPVLCHGQIINTIAGGGITLGDGGPATAANLNMPSGIAYDNAGNLYIADAGHYRIRKVDNAGFITTVAGNGTQGATGDNGPATAATLAGLNKIYVDDSADIYIPDSYNNKIRKVTVAGIITTIAGTGFPGSSGDSGLATAARLSSPYDVAMDRYRNIYIADVGNHKIRKIAPDGIITSLPLSISPVFSVSGLTFDAIGNLYMVDGNNKVYIMDTFGTVRVSAGNGSIGYSGNGGPATAASMDGVQGVAADNAGNIYVAEVNNNIVRSINPSGIIAGYAGTGSLGFYGDGGPSIAARINDCGELTTNPAGWLVIADRGNNRIRMISNCSNTVISSPVNYSSVVGGGAVFNVTTTSGSLSLQWQADTGTGYADLPNSAPYSGVTTTTLLVSFLTTTQNNTQYRCKVTDVANGCYTYSAAATLYVTDPTTAVSNTSTQAQPDIYPNPAGSYITVTSPGSEINTISLLDMTGREVLNKLNVNTTKLTLPVNDLPAGYYLVKVITAKGVAFKKIVKE